MISFDDTEIAFRSKSNKDLNRAYFAFLLISRPLLVTLGKTLLGIALKLHLPIKAVVKATVYRQFCGGTSLRDCRKTIEALGESNIGVIPDYAVEGKETEEGFDRSLSEILKVFQLGSEFGNIPFAVFKCTSLGRPALYEKISKEAVLTPEEAEAYERVKHRIDTICKTACGSSCAVLIDAEESWMQKAMDDIAEKMMKAYNKERAVVYNTLQMYRKDRLSFLKACLDRSIKEGYVFGAKLVRGAYMEKERSRALHLGYESPVHRTKQETDRDYNLALGYCIAHINCAALFAGTHNENSCRHLVRMMDIQGLKPGDSRVYFAQLYGMSDHISFALAAAGYRVAKYVPYGPVREAMPYLIRRAEENTSVASQTGRELALLKKEKERRRMVK